MSQKKLYILRIEIGDDGETCDSITEEFIYPELSLPVGEHDLVDYFDDEALELCWDCDEVGLT
tara:strand:- start:68 stop:256 length:189 start_codon:yes stop_codon:yes gene_type:complete